MRIVLLGAPGSGKGTQSAAIVERFHVQHIATGDMLRAEVAAGSSLGKRAKAIMEEGGLVSDDIMLGMIEGRLASTALQTSGFLLDGFPRTLPQAEALDALLIRMGRPLDVALLFEVDYDEIMKRLLLRHRADDDADTVRKRLQVYEAQTAPLIQYYQQQNKLRRVQGMGDIHAISEQIFGILDQAA
jgi:adenylate kinase